MNRDIRLEVLVAVVVTIGGVWLYELLHKHAVLTAVSAVILVLAAVVVAGFKRELRLMLRRAPGCDLNGTWDTTWRYEKDGTSVEVRDSVKLRQIGSFVWGHGLSADVTGPAAQTTFEYRLQGAINEERVVDGSWENVDSGRRYYGTFLLHVNRGGDAMSGGWLGIAQVGFRTGTWTWAKRR